MKEEAKIPAWAVGIIFSVILVVFGGAVAWGVQKAEVENIKNDIQTLKPMTAAAATSVAVINAEIPVMKNDIREIKEVQSQMRQEQIAFQSDIQKDIKTLLAQRGR